MASRTLVEQFRQDIGNVSSTVDERQLRQKSHDFHWYSPVLTRNFRIAWRTLWFSRGARRKSALW